MFLQTAAEDGAAAWVGKIVISEFYFPKKDTVFSPSARSMMYNASSSPSSVPEVLAMTPPVELRTNTIWPRPGYVVSSRTPSRVSAPRPVQLTTMSARCLLWCSAAASATCDTMPRRSWTLWARHWPTSQGRYSAVLMQTDVKALAEVMPGPS